MPTIRSRRIPGYCPHKASGQAIVRLAGKVHYLGKVGTPKSYAKYARLIADWNGGRPEPPRPQPEEITIIELIAAWRRHAVRHYRKDGQPTGEAKNFDHAAKPLLALYGDELARDFGPLKLQAVRSLLVTGFTTRLGKPVAPASRSTVNARIGRIKRIFRWAESQELVPPSLSHALATVKGLQRGRTEARETEPIGPADDRHVEATLACLPPVVADMARVQRLTGCRPGEVCAMRPVDVDRGSTPWLYRPASHKTEHHGRARVIFIGPKAQQILLPYLLRDPETHCFTPADSERKRKERLRENRKTPVQPSQVDRSKRRPQTRPTGRYTKDAYARAVRRACDAANANAMKDNETDAAGERVIPRWTPNQLRHTAATEIRRRFGLEAAQVCLGHSAANITQIYAERDSALGLEVMRQIG